MHDLIRRTVHRLGLLFGPGTGTRRAGDRRPARTGRHAGDPVRPLPPLPPLPPFPPHRSPYGLHLPLDGAEARLVRPYLAVHEQERTRQRRRRVALVLAADFGIDPDRHVVGAGRAAA
ncbi:hypothetical protein GCM10019016_016270 [Streptomyces prasinosporus]|uniref:Uncharacterized protein n=1 Tax=Streptomyces prasinosporus TaxID=68256 RepID=A0ABP6TH30_9ACTN